jgi:hypothetical protein
VRGWRNRFFVPDFWLPDEGKAGEFHEVKGWMDDNSRIKIERFRKYFPDLVLVVIDGRFFRQAERIRLCRVIENWECSHQRHR